MFRTPLDSKITRFFFHRREDFLKSITKRCLFHGTRNLNKNLDNVFKLNYAKDALRYASLIGLVALVHDLYKNRFHVEAKNSDHVDVELVKNVELEEKSSCQPLQPYNRIVVLCSNSTSNLLIDKIIEEHPNKEILLLFDSKGLSFIFNSRSHDLKSLIKHRYNENEKVKINENEVELINIPMKMIKINGHSEVFYDSLIMANDPCSWDMNNLFKCSNDQVKSRVITPMDTVKILDMLDDFFKNDTNNKSVLLIGNDEISFQVYQKLKSYSLGKVKIYQLCPSKSSILSNILPEYLAKHKTELISSNEMANYKLIENDNITASGYDEKDRKVVIQMSSGDTYKVDYVVDCSQKTFQFDFLEKFMPSEQRPKLIASSEAIRVNKKFQTDTFSVYAVHPSIGYFSSTLKKFFHYSSLIDRKTDNQIIGTLLSNLNNKLSSIKFEDFYQLKFLLPDGSNIHISGFVDSQLPTSSVWLTSETNMEDKKKYDHGIVFYLSKNKEIVGLVSLNLPLQREAVKDILQNTATIHLNPLDIVKKITVPSDKAQPEQNTIEKI